jgi:2'-5' RNA ligase
MTTDAQARTDRLSENLEVEWLNVPKHEDDGVTAAVNLNADGTEHTGAMIALLPVGDRLDDLSVGDGEPPEQLHLTLVYLGDAVDFDEQERQDIRDGIAELAGRQPVIEAEAFGVSVFNPLGDEPCLVLVMGGEPLGDVQASAAAVLDEAEVAYAEPRLPWIPHVTLAYWDDPLPGDSIEIGEVAQGRMGPLRFDRLRVAFGGEVTDYDLNESMLASAPWPFHLAGQHDQRSHGRGGVGAHASPEEARISQKLSAGKKLDPSNPTEARMAGAIDSWTRFEANGIGDEIASTVNFDPTSDTAGGLFVRAVAAAPPGAPTLHRGMHSVPSEKVPRPGDRFDLGPTSFTRSSRVADDFASPKSPPREGTHIVHTRVEKGSRAMKIDQQQGKYSWLDEHVGLGRYEVTGRRDTVKTIKIGGEKVDVTVTDLDIRQIDDFAGDTDFKPGEFI